MALGIGNVGHRFAAARGAVPIRRLLGDLCAMGAGPVSRRTVPPGRAPCTLGTAPGR